MNRIRDFLHRHELERNNVAGDFTTNWRVIPVSLLAVCIGAVAAGVAWLLLRLIGLRQISSITSAGARIWSRRPTTISDIGPCWYRSSVV